MNSLFADRYKFDKKLGQGTYGTVYSALDTYLNTQVVLKLNLAQCSLAREAEAYKIIHRHWSPEGIPRMYAYVQNYREYIVMQKLGKSISFLLDICGGRFSLKTVAMLGIQMLSRLQSVHNHGIVHGDIKDDNFVMDEQCKTVYLIDFGLCRFYIDKLTGIHVTEEFDPTVMGTLLFASINTHNQIRLSRRDDIESLAYMLIRCLKGALPWENNGLAIRSYSDAFAKIGTIKRRTGIYSLCAGIPVEFTEFMLYTRRLAFSERPNYTYLKDLLRQVLLQRKQSNDGVYDWMANASVVDDT